jgi:hypothetical protein
MLLQITDNKLRRSAESFIISFRQSIHIERARKELRFYADEDFCDLQNEVQNLRRSLLKKSENREHCVCD